MYEEKYDARAMCELIGDLSSADLPLTRVMNRTFFTSAVEWHKVIAQIAYTSLDGQQVMSLPYTESHPTNDRTMIHRRLMSAFEIVVRSRQTVRMCADPIAPVPIGTMRALGRLDSPRRSWIHRMTTRMRMVLQRS